MSTESFEDHNRYQRDYYESRHKPNMQPSGSPYVLRQLERTIQTAGLSAERPLLEVGAGLGRYTLPLLERGFSVTALDLSPVMLETLDRTAGNRRLTTVACDLAEAGQRLHEPFSQAVGFFTLHHMHDLDSIFRGLSEVLTPGATVAFCEPNAFNPLFYVQILITPGMTWRGDGGIVHMKRKEVLGAMRRAGFTDLALDRFGFFPPFVVNRAIGARIEEGLQSLRALRQLTAFAIFSGRWPGR